MSDTRLKAALEAAQGQIERLLRATFEQLDPLTPDAEIRRHLYAALIARAATMANERLPGSADARGSAAAIPGNACLPEVQCAAINGRSHSMGEMRDSCSACG